MVRPCSPTNLLTDVSQLPPIGKNNKKNLPQNATGFFY
jgi:hypothetical protein